MSIRVDLSPLIAGSVVVGDPGLGVPGSLIPATGEHGPGYAYDDLIAGDETKEIRGLIVTPPTNGTLTAFEDTSFEYDGTSDTFSYQLYVDGVARGSVVTHTINIGSVAIQTWSLSSGLFSSVGAASGAYAARRVSADTGSFVTQGYDAAAEAGLRFVTSGGAVAVTGSASGGVRSLLFGLESVTLLYSGGASSAIQTSAFSLGSGECSVSGTQSQGIVSRILVAAPASFAFAPGSSLLLHNRVLVGQTGQIQTTGFDLANAVLGRFMLGPGEYVSLGRALMFSTDAQLTPSAYGTIRPYEVRVASRPVENRQTTWPRDFRYVEHTT